MSDFPERLDSCAIYESDWICLYQDRVRMPSGQIIDTYHRLHYPHESVCVVIANEQDELLLIRSKRYVTNRLEWEIPAGRVETGESPEYAAHRECLEETGCTLQTLTYMGRQNPANGMSDLTMHMFFARVATEGEQISVDEVAERRWMTRQQVEDLLHSNGIQCGVSMLALLYAMQFYPD